MTTLTLSLRIATQNFHGVRKLSKFFECRHGTRIFERCLKVKIETIAPRRASDWTALDLQQIQIATRKRIQGQTQRARFVREVQNQRKLVGVFGHLGRWREQQKTSVIFRMVLEMLLQNRCAVD